MRPAALTVHGKISPETTLMTYAIGIDFGTTNSVVAIASANGHVESLQWPSHQGDGTQGMTETFRTALMFWQDGRPPQAELRSVAGPQAIARAASGQSGQRFVQSIKSHLASKAFSEARFFGKRFLIEELVATFLGHLLVPHDGHHLARASHLLSGRPVVFAGHNADEALALGRLRKAYALSGFPGIDFAYEPLGAAYWYARNLTRDETVLVADFGGGTSDFSILRFEHAAGRLSAKPLAHGGCAIAGDTFDFRLIDHLVAPKIGKGSLVRSFGKRLPLPAYLHAVFAQWHHLSFLKSAANSAELKRLIAASEVPEQLQVLADIIDLDLGFELHQAIGAVKVQLSQDESARFAFDAAGVALSADVTRAEFETWIAPDIAQIGQAMDATLARASLSSSQVDAVFLTGGSSYVPALRAVFAQRFGGERIHIGHAFQSVAQGLALLAVDRARQMAA